MLNKMNIFENVNKEMNRLIPSSLLSDIACFVFYDNHPKDDKNIDITVCTKNGELREYFLRDLQSTLNLNCLILQPCDLRILRNKNSELFYLLAAKDELFIISRKQNQTLQVYKKLTNIDRYYVNDTACTGETLLKVIRKDDAMPLLFNSNFESLDESGVIFSNQNTEDSFPILNELRRKLVEAQYSTKCNEKTYADYLNLHQKFLLLSCQNHQPAESSVFKTTLNRNSIPGTLKVNTHETLAKVCNTKIVIIFNVTIQDGPIENIQILLHNTTMLSLVYTTKIFIKIPTPPYWKEAQSRTFEPGQVYAITAVINLEEFKESMTSRVELNGSITYEISKQEVLVPFDDVVISLAEMMGDELDVLSSGITDQNSLVAVLAATEKTQLCLRHIKEDADPHVFIPDLFCTHLQMGRVQNASNVIISRKSPYHALNGTMLVFHERISDNAVLVSVHSRSPSQVVTLLHCIYDAVPAKIVITTPSYRITAKFDRLQHYNEDIPNTHNLNYMDYATSMLNRSAKILEHLDKCMIKMNESKNPSVTSKVGTHIDLFACGVDTFKEFRESMLMEAKKGIAILTNPDVVRNVDVEMLEAEQDVDSLMKSCSIDLDEDTGSDVICIN